SKTQEENGGAKRRQSLLGFFVLIHLATAISGNPILFVRLNGLRECIPSGRTLLNHFRIAIACLMLRDHCSLMI
ncbi:MAG: hypothetical protein ACK56Y_07915, partial [Pseudanabaena sp.]